MKRNGLGRKWLAMLMILMMLVMGTSCGAGGSASDDEDDADEETEMTDKSEDDEDDEDIEDEDVAEDEVDEEAIDEEEPAVDEDSEDAASGEVFDYEIESRSAEDDGIVIAYPELVNANDSDKMDRINLLIQDDINAFAENIIAQADGSGELTMELAWEHELYENQALSVIYKGMASTTESAYPISIYHTIVINLVEGTQLSLTDAFDVNEDFAEAFRLGMYAVTREDLNLEESGVNLTEVIESQGSASDLAELMQDPSTPFVLALYGVIVSIPVEHALGDHLEMAINYENIESSLKRDTCSVWSDYLAMSDGGGAEDANSGMLLYENGRFGFSLHYPDLFGEPVESDNGDGITLESEDGSVTLLIWAGYNLEPVDGAALLSEVKDSISGVQSDWSSDAYYGVTFDGGDADPVRFVQAGYAGTDASVHFRMSFPVEDEALYADYITSMTNELMIN